MGRACASAGDGARLRSANQAPQQRDLLNVHGWFSRQRAGFDVDAVFVELLGLLFGGPAADKLSRRQGTRARLKP